MFSYNRHGPSENNLIEQIHDIAQDIFESHLSSIVQTDNQQLSLELSSGSESDHNQESFQSFEDRSNCNQNSQKKSSNQRKITEEKNMPQFYGSCQYELQQQNTRMTRSTVLPYKKNLQDSQIDARMIGSHLQPFRKIQKPKSNNYSAISYQQSSKDKGYKSFHTQQSNRSPLKTKKVSNISPHKFSSKYASNYVSPYSKKSFNNPSYPKSYMQKGNPQINQPKQTASFKFIKKRIKENVEPYLSYRKNAEDDRSKSHKKNASNKKYSKIASKYMQAKPIMSELQGYVDEHIYKKTKDDLSHFNEKAKFYESMSPEEVEYRWEDFIEREELFLEQKKQRQIAKRIQSMQYQTNGMTPPKKSHSLSKSTVSNSVKMTVEDHIRKIKRQKQLLKQRLQLNEVSNFLQKSFEDSKKFGDSIFDSVYGVEKKENSGVERCFETVNQYSTISQSETNTYSGRAKRVKNIENAVEFMSGKNKTPRNGYMSPKQSHITKIENSSKKIVERLRSSSSSPERDTSRFNYTGGSPQPLANPKNVSELLNPKYFKSINELQEYNSVASQEKIEKQHPLQNKNFFKTPNCYQRNKIGHFDPNVMNSAIEQIQKAKRLRQTNLVQQNQDSYISSDSKSKKSLNSYRNISNLYPNQPSKPFPNQRERKEETENTKAHSNHFAKKDPSPIFYESNTQKSHINRRLSKLESDFERSASQSPIGKQESISVVPSSVQSGQIAGSNSEKKSSNEASNSVQSQSAIKVANKKEIEFLFQDYIKEEY